MDPSNVVIKTFVSGKHLKTIDVTNTLFAKFVFVMVVFISLGRTNGYSQTEYTYDSNGSLFKDLNKSIISIHYNYLNLADTITYQDGRKIIYGYSNAGVKLEEHVLLPDGRLLKKRDYIGEYQYVNDTLTTIQSGNDRLVPSVPGTQNTTWEYQYILKDHLGNVRTVLTSLQTSDNAQSTFETSSLISEQYQFLRMEDARRVNSVLFDHTKSGTTYFAQRLNGSSNEKYGLARSLSVMPGDTIKLKVFAKYVASNSVDLTSALTTLLTQIASGTAPAGTVVDGTSYATNGSIPFPFAGMNSTSQNTDAGPKAYLNWLVFDRNFALKTGGYKKMSTIANENGTNVAHEKLEAKLIITSPGYVYTYLSNEEPTPVEVYFDDFTVTHVKGPVVQETEYDPFGFISVDNDREHAVPNNYLYNGKELQKDFDLNWYDYGARLYDAALGRWHVIDPKAEKYTAWTPYNYGLNDPAKNIDPDGRDVIAGAQNVFVPGSKVAGVKENTLLQKTLDLISGNPILKQYIDQVSKDKTKAVHIIQSDKRILLDETAIGYTTHAFRDSDTDVSYAPSAPGIIISSSEEEIDGLNINHDVASGKEATVIVLGKVEPLYEQNGDFLDGEYAQASVLLHELIAHVILDPGKALDLINRGAIDHFRYGEVGGQITPGSIGDKVDKELIRLQTEQRKKEAKERGGKYILRAPEVIINIPKK